MTPPFETVYSSFEVPLLRDAYIAITACDLWDWMREYTPEEGTGFMFATDPNLQKIVNVMRYTGHSGASYAWTMRVMEDIAKRGWDVHKTEVRRIRALRNLERWAADQRVSKPTSCPCRAALGYRTGWCGVAGGGVPACEH